ncbi:hypothetical protein ASD65_10570 [Microbacterium sp. Root61]|uniref:zinc-dependent alcohol dehydrogenase n=1 Tax=Microbacterium sp. Root61 TaxID=1736570 RepID=UPI0006FCBD07|nr:zinc-binding dehydrogenase [Microbacterium sp. Root61]KRA24816.1 hypothetical protein ASD65_10570 [Microbacterium sp. Root61]
MRAVRLEEIGRVGLVEVDDALPGPGEIVVATIATGICGSDIHGYTGENGRRFPGQVMGHETVGRIAAVGAEVDPALYPLGALVTVNPVIVPSEEIKQYAGREQHDPRRRIIGVDPTIVSAFAEQYAVPVANVVVLPEMENPLLAALIEPLAVALHAVHRVGVQSGHVVLVVGGGPIGQSCVLAAQRAGASLVIVSEPNEGRREVCAALGAEVLDPTRAGVPDAVRARTDGRGADIAIDAVGSSATIGDALRSTMLGGGVCLVGMATPNVSLDAYRISTDERVLVGSFTYPAKTFQEAAEWVAEGAPVLSTLISEVVAPGDADAVFQRLGRTLDVPGKVLIRFAADSAPVFASAAIDAETMTVEGAS